MKCVLALLDMFMDHYLKNEKIFLEKTHPKGYVYLLENICGEEDNGVQECTEVKNSED